jgi:hypothetical protein
MLLTAAAGAAAPSAKAISSISDTSITLNFLRLLFISTSTLKIV